MSQSLRQAQQLHREDYFSLEDILATQERLPCKVSTQILNMGFLDSASESQHLVVGTKLELPYWLAKSQSSKRRNIISVELPKQYRDSYREIMVAEASVVDLHKLGPHFYAFGCLIAQFNFPDAVDVAQSLLQTFQNRFRMLMDSAQNAFGEDYNQLTLRLDEAEKRLFRTGLRDASQYRAWECRESEQLVMTDMVLNHKKRKRAQMELDS